MHVRRGFMAGKFKFRSLSLRAEFRWMDSDGLFRDFILRLLHGYCVMHEMKSPVCRLDGKRALRNIREQRIALFMTGFPSLFCGGAAGG